MLLTVLLTILSVESFGVVRVDPTFFGWNSNNYGLAYSKLLSNGYCQNKSKQALMTGLNIFDKNNLTVFHSGPMDNKRSFQYKQPLSIVQYN